MHKQGSSVCARLWAALWGGVKVPIIELPAATAGSRETAARRRSQRGQSMVEFALTAPILVLLLLGVAEIGRGVNSYLIVLAAARDGARLYSEGNATTSTVQTMIQKETQKLPTGQVPTSDITIDTSHATGSVDATVGSNDVKVKVCYNHPLLIGIPAVMSGTLKLCSQTTMRMVI